METQGNFLEASLRPPAHDHQPADEAGAGAPGSWAMLDVRAYIADRRNASTAYGRMSNGGVIQVTFCAAPPPAVSYLCVWCPEPTHLDGIGTEPRITAAEADLAVVRVALGSGFDCDDPRCQDTFVYHAGGGGGEKIRPPSLSLISLDDDPYRLFSNTGILRHGDDDRYCIVALSYSKPSWQFILHVFDSMTQSWSSKRIFVGGREHQHSQFRHATRKVIMLGEGGMVAFVDPWRGLLVCDVLDDSEPAVHYIPFPRPLKDNKKPLLQLQPATARDVAVVQGRIKVIYCFYCSASGAFKASVRSRAATSLRNTNWVRDYMFEIRDSLVDANTLHFELLPELRRAGDDSSGRRTLEELYIAHPILSLSDDHNVYFMAKVGPWDDEAWVLAVDLKKKRLQDVGVFHAVRNPDAALSYIHSRISKYFNTTPGCYKCLAEHGYV